MFYVDNQEAGSCTQEPYAVTISGLAIGEHTLKAVASNASGETSTASVSIKIISDNSVENLPAWNRETVYATGGTQVLYNHKVWSNKWWTQGDVPGETAVWAFVSDAAGDN